MPSSAFEACPMSLAGNSDYRAVPTLSQCDASRRNSSRYSLTFFSRAARGGSPSVADDRTSEQSPDHHTHHERTASTNAHHSDRFRHRCGSNRQGFVANFARPGGNVTGFIFTEPTMVGKWLELLKKIAPRIARVAMLFNPTSATYADYWLKPFKAAAPSFAVEAIVAPLRDKSELETVIAAQARAQMAALSRCPIASRIPIA
jgi:ABC transporter substrate binding protein